MVHRSFRNALKWSLVMDGGQQVMTMVVTLVLAGLLGPRAFGTVAMATVYILFVQMLVQQGMVPAIIQRKHLAPEHRDSAFWLVLGSSGVLTLASIGLSGWWAGINNLPELRNVVCALSLLIPLKGLVVVQEALLRRELHFRPLAVRTNVSVFVGAVVGITAALGGAGVWALVAQQLATGVVEVVVLWSVTTWRPRLRFSWSRAKDLLGFSVASSVASFGVFANNYCDALVIGLFFGPTAVGLYRFASRFVDVAVNLSARSMQAVSLPELARYQDAPAQFRDRMLAIIRLSALLAIPLLAILAASSDALTAVVGPEWADAAAPLRVLALVGAVRAVTFVNGPMLQALGRPHQLAVLTWLGAICSVAGFVIAGWILADTTTAVEVMGMAVSRAVVYGGIFLVVNIVLVIRVCRVPLSRLGRAVAAPVAAGLAALAVGGLVGAVASFAPLMQLAAVALTASVAAGGTLLALDADLRATAVQSLAAARRPRGPDVRTPEPDAEPVAG